MQNVLSNDDLRAIAPAIFADHAHNTVSDKYSFLPTIEVVEGMRREGWMPMVAQECRVRHASTNRGFQKHLIRFRQSSDLQKQQQECVEILLTNSHNRSSAYQLHAGIFRMICSNGMVVADATFQRISIKHVGFETSQVIDASFKLLADVPKVMADIDAMKAKQLQAPQAKAFAEAALIAKYEDLEAAPINAEKLLVPRRIEDRKADVWTTFNVIQENIVKGGLKDRSKRKENGKAFPRTRAVTSIDENVKLNKALWHLSKTLALSL